MVLSLCVGLLCVLKFGNEDICTRILSQVQGDAVILFGKVCLWLLVLLFTAYAEHHHSKARSRGYLRFYRQMQRVKLLPFTTHSAGRSPKCGTYALALRLHKMAVMFNRDFGGGAFSCRKRSAAPGCFYATVMSSENLLDAQHPPTGAHGGAALSGLLHR